MHYAATHAGTISVTLRGWLAEQASGSFAHGLGRRKMP